MLPLKQRMFRQKPYTKCFECLQTKKIKCKKCMSDIIESIIKKKQQLEQFQVSSHFKKNRNTELNPVLTKTSYPKKQTLVESTYEVNSNYNLWMENVKIKRANTTQNSRRIWPSKVKVEVNKMKIKAKPKFQMWEKKIIEKLAKSKNQENYKYLEMFKKIR